MTTLPTVVRFTSIPFSYNPSTRNLAQEVEQTVTTNEINSIIDSHFKQHSGGRMISLLNILRHDCTNYDVVSPKYYRGKKAERVHYEIHQLLMDCFVSHIVRRVNSGLAALAELDNLTGQVDNLTDEVADLKEEIKNLKAQKEAARLEERRKLFESWADAGEDGMIQFFEENLDSL